MDIFTNTFHFFKYKITNSLATVGEYSQFFYDIFDSSARSPPQLRQILDQIYIIGVSSIPFVSFTGLCLGCVLAEECFIQLADKGFESSTGLIVVKALMLETAPIMTAFVITGSAGAAMCAELGSMEVTEQVNALKSMSVEPTRYLITPRLIASIIALPILTIFCTFTGIFGGYLVSIYGHNMAPDTFFSPMYDHVRAFEWLNLFIKSVVFGIIMVAISCYQGINTRNGAAGVGRATTNSVVISYCLILLTDVVISMMLNNYYPYLEAKFHI